MADKETTTEAKPKRKRVRPSGAQRKQARRTRAKAVIVNPPLIDVGTRVRYLGDKTVVGTVESVEVGDRVPVLVVRTHRDGFIVRYNYDQVELDA